MSMVAIGLEGILDRPGEASSLAVNPLVWSMIGFAAGIYLFLRGLVLLKRKRFISGVPQSTIRGASLGLVEVSGKVEGPYTIIAPLSAKDCYYYRAIAWTGDGRERRKAADETLSAPLFLNDGTGRLIIAVAGAKTELPCVFSEEYTQSVPDYANRFLNRHGASGASTTKIEEYAICPGDTLFAMGTLRDARSVSGERIRFVSCEAAELQREEALGGVAPSDATRIVAVETSKNFDLNPPVLLIADEHHPLFLSTQSQREILQTLAWRSALYIWGGPILTLVCFWYLMSALGYLG